MQKGHVIFLGSFGPPTACLGNMGIYQARRCRGQRVERLSVLEVVGNEDTNFHRLLLFDPAHALAAHQKGALVPEARSGHGNAPFLYRDIEGVGPGL